MRCKRESCWKYQSPRLDFPFEKVQFRAWGTFHVSDKIESLTVLNTSFIPLDKESEIEEDDPIFSLKASKPLLIHPGQLELISLKKSILSFRRLPGEKWIPGKDTDGRD